jgi:[ribosomal protein S18]-alanine N-acetyltransferase
LQKALSVNVTIEAMKESDLEEVLAIEKKSFADPWSRRLFRETLSFPHSVSFVMHGSNGALLGYINFYVIAQEGHMLNLAIHPAWRKKGFATRLLTHSLDYLKQQNAMHFFLEVRERNLDAIGLYRKFGFEIVGKRKRYYVETNEDALVMHLACGSLQHG